MFKVVIKGSNMFDDSPFCIVKNGDYTKDAAGVLEALKSGYVDKEGEFPPDFRIVDFIRVSTTGTKIPSYKAVIEEKESCGKKIAALYHVQVMYKSLA